MMVTVIGESGSGKSEYAENLIMELAGGSTNSEKMYYIATMKPFGKAAMERIKRHLELRKGKGFTTIECYKNIENCGLKKGGNVLLECMSNIIANELFDNNNIDKEDVYYKVCSGIDKLNDTVANLVVVTNDVFEDGIIYDKETMEYIELLGRVNRYLAGISSKVVEVIYSCPLTIS